MTAIIMPVALPLPLSKGEDFVRWLTLHAASTTDGDLEMQIESTSTGPKMCKCFSCSSIPFTLFLLQMRASI
jgi:hypothetical protein